MLKVIAKHREIVSELVEELPYAAGKTGRGEWTPKVKSTMHDLCIRHLGSCSKEFWGTHHCKDGHRHQEWLLDAAWYVDGDEEGIILGLESEFEENVDAVRSDFAKLLTTKAPIKILLFGAKKYGEYVRDIEKLCRRWTQHTAGDLIYIINFYEGKHETFFGQALRSGQIPDFTLHELSELCGDDIYKAVS